MTADLHLSTEELFDRARLLSHSSTHSIIDELERRHLVLRDRVVAIEGDITAAQAAWERAGKVVG